MKLVILTGMSGAGKSTALKVLEDSGYFCVDNLPVPLLERYSELLAQDSKHSEMEKVAVGIDIRSVEHFDELKAILQKMREDAYPLVILFLDCNDKALIKRYKETRRSHPLAHGERVEIGIALEREKIQFLRRQADYTIDTSHLLARELKVELENIFVKNQEYKNLFVTILSFGFKYGIPTDSDLVFDVRFLPNPFYVEGLRAKTGNDKEVQDFVMRSPEAHKFSDKLEDMVTFLIPNFVIEGKNQLVISIGCTGGKHRSVTLANELFHRLQKQEDLGIKIEHRDIGKDALRGK